LESHLLEKGEGWGFANQFNPTTILRLSQDMDMDIFRHISWFLKYHKIKLFIVVLIWDESQKDLEKKAVMDITFSQPVVNAPS
jgi:hypothetical protein